MTKRYAKKHQLDQFFTNPDVALQLINEMEIEKYALVVEPSAGCGSFSKHIPNCLALDIAPQAEKIIQQDFLTFKYNGHVDRKDILCIGNPPFGKQSNLAVKFINKCTEFANTIAFILPLSFMKTSIQKRINLNYHLKSSKKMPDNIFIFNNKQYDVPTVFQVWEWQPIPREQVKKILPSGYSYTAKNNADCSVRRVGFYAGRGYLEVEKSEQSHYFLKIENKQSIKKLIDCLNSHDWKHENTVGPRSISKNELNSVLNNIIDHILPLENN